MTTIQEPHIRCKGQTVSDEYRRWVFEHMPHVGSLLDNLDAGVTPTFLDIMAAISEIVAFTTEGDHNLADSCKEEFLMSGNICRFSS